MVPFILNLSLGGDEWSASRPRLLYPRRNNPRYPLDRRLGGPNEELHKCENSSSGNLNVRSKCHAHHRTSFTSTWQTLTIDDWIFHEFMCENTFLRSVNVRFSHICFQSCVESRPEQDYMSLWDSIYPPEVFFHTSLLLLVCNEITSV
jgi:hypothetical protein